VSRRVSQRAANARIAEQGVAKRYNNKMVDATISASGQRRSSGGPVP
jgi:hypothetical protein